MLNTVPSTLAMKLARYWSSSATFKRQKAERRRNAEVGTRNIMTRFAAFVSSAHCSILANAPTPRDAVRQDPDAEPADLPADPAQDGVRPLHGAGEEADGEGEHGASPHYPRAPRRPRRDQRTVRN